MANLASAYFGITKSEKLDDGTLMVYGKATDDSLDIDQQICDADWLKRAMPQWFETGGNIREQHSSIAAGVATALEAKGSAFYISVHVVDPISVVKVEKSVLKGFSVGIKNPRVIHDEKAVNGRIVDGIIVEVSLVDRPANPTCQLVLAKSVSGESTLIQVEEMIEKEAKVKTTSEILAQAKAVAGDITKFDAGLYETARTALAQLIIVEAQEMVDGHDEEMSLNALLSAVSNLMWWYRGEEAEGETTGEHHEGEMKMSKEKEMDAEADAAAKKKKEMDADAEAGATAKEAEAMCDKCNKSMKECDCADKAEGLGEQNSGEGSSANLDTATIVEPKSAEADEVELPAETPAEENVPTEVSDETVVSPEEVEAIVEKAVKSAVDSVKTEVAKAYSAKEAELLAKAASLEEELAKAKSAAVAGGPRRTIKAIDDTAPNNALVKAAVARAKANATNDPELRKGYIQMAEEYTKAADAQITK